MAPGAMRPSRSTWLSEDHAFQSAHVEQPVERSNPNWRRPLAPSAKDHLDACIGIKIAPAVIALQVGLEECIRRKHEPDAVLCILMLIEPGGHTELTHGPLDGLLCSWAVARTNHRYA